MQYHYCFCDHVHMKNEICWRIDKSRYNISAFVYLMDYSCYVNLVYILSTFAKLRKRLLTSSFRPSVRRHGTSLLPLDGFSLNLIFEYFSKIYRENSSSITIRQEYQVLYMKTNIRFFIYLPTFFLE
jgi:hypothetical protein